MADLMSIIFDTVNTQLSQQCVLLFNTQCSLEFRKILRKLYWIKNSSHQVRPIKHTEYEIKVPLDQKSVISFVKASHLKIVKILRGRYYFTIALGFSLYVEDIEHKTERTTKTALCLGVSEISGLQSCL